MKTTKRIIVAIMAMIISISAGALTASAATAELTSDMSIAYSGTLSAKRCKYSANNTSKETKKDPKIVYAIAKCKSGAVFVTKDSYTLAAGKSFVDEKTPSVDKKTTWKLALNPKGANTTGCTATGSISKLS